MGGDVAGAPAHVDVLLPVTFVCHGTNMRQPNERTDRMSNRKCERCGTRGSHVEEQPWGETSCSNPHTCVENQNLKSEAEAREYLRLVRRDQEATTMLCPRCRGARFLQGPSQMSRCPNCQASGVVIRGLLNKNRIRKNLKIDVI